MDLGFRVKNYLTLVGLLFLVACVPTAKKTKCPGSQAYDSNLRTCVPSLSSSGNSIFVTSKSPSNSYAMSLTGASVAHSVTVTDVYSSGYQVRWFVNFSNPPTTVSNQLVASGTTSYTFDPDGGGLYNDGAYTLEAVVYDAAGLAIVDSESWSITVHADDIPTIVNNVPTSPSITLANDLTTYTFDAQALNPDDQVGTYEWYLNGALQGAPAAIPTGGGTTPQALADLVINPSGLANGTHSVTLTFYDGGGGVFSSFTWGILVTDPNLPIVQSYAPSAPDIIDVVDGITQAAGGYMQNNSALTFTFTVDDYTKMAPDTLEVQFKIDGGSVYTQAFAANTINVSTGLPALNLANSQIPETHTIEAVIKTTGSNRIAASYTWTIDLRPANTSPILTIDHASGTLTCNPTTPVSVTSSTDIEGKGCTVNQLNPITPVPVTVVVEIEDEDYENATVQDYTHFGITFELNGENMDGTATLSDDVCTSAPNVANTAAILTCTFGFDSFGTGGPLAPGTYELTAVAVDDGSPFSVTPANSSEVKWTIEVGEDQSGALDVKTQELALGSLPSLTNSYFELTTAACTPTGSYLNNTLTIPAAQELDYVLIHTVVEDPQRDNFFITVDMENANPALPAGTYTTVAPLTLVTRVDNTQNYIHTSCVQIPEWVRWNGSDGTVNVRVSVSDSPSLMTTAIQSDSETYSLYVVNNNPAPTFTSTTAESPLVGGSYNVLAGFPFTFNPSSYSDASTIDGNNVTFQWQVNYNAGGFVDIPGATNATLVWTPSPSVADGNPTEIRLCLGDDGGNAADCAVVSATQTWSNITVYTNTQAGQTSDSEVANWFDETDSKLYQVRVNTAVLSVDQYDVDTTTGAQTLLNTITFTAEHPDLTNVTSISELSAVGVDSTALYIAYKVITDATSRPEIRIRRIELGTSSFGFSYVMDIVDGTGGDITVGGLGNPTHTVQFTGVPAAAETITVNGVTLTYGTDFCSPSCASQAATAASFAAAISAHANPILSNGVQVTYVGGSDTVTLDKEVDWCDVNTKISPTIGQIKHDGALFYLPYSNVSNSQRVSMISKVAPGATLLECPDPDSDLGHTDLAATGTFTQAIANDIDDTGAHFLALKNSSGNIDVHRLTNALAYVEGDTNIFTLGSYVAINSPSLSVGDSGTNPNVFVSVLFEDGSGDLTLGGAIYDATNYTNNSIISGFTLSHDLIQDIANAKVLASPSEAGSAIVGVVDNDAGPLYQAYAAKWTMADVVTYATDLTFENRTYPPLSINTGAVDTNIFLSEASSVTFGDDGANAGENTRNIILYTHHPADDAQTTIVNIDDADTDANDTSLIGSYPAFIPAN